MEQKLTELQLKTIKRVSGTLTIFFSSVTIKIKKSKGFEKYFLKFSCFLLILNLSQSKRTATLCSACTGIYTCVDTRFVKDRSK
jgi:hypothetical protein